MGSKSGAAVLLCVAQPPHRSPAHRTACRDLARTRMPERYILSKIPDSWEDGEPRRARAIAVVPGRAGRRGLGDQRVDIIRCDIEAEDVTDPSLPPRMAMASMMPTIT